MQLHGVRWYDPASQRWLSQDPAGWAGRESVSVLRQRADGWDGPERDVEDRKG